MLPPQGCSWSGADSCELPRRALRHLIIGHGLSVGSRVFDTAPEGGSLVGFLKALQIEALGWAHLPPRSQARPSSAVEKTARSLEPRIDLLSAAGPFDVIVARELPSLRQSLLFPGPLAATAHLLSCIRPGGSLVYAVRSDLDSGNRYDHHAAACYRSHLETFRGRVTVAEFPDGLLHADPLRWIARRQGRTLLASLHIPTGPISPGEWFAAATAGVSTASCCRAFASRADRSHAA